MHNLSNGPIDDLSLSVYMCSKGDKWQIDLLDADPVLCTDLAGHWQRLLRLLVTVAQDSEPPIGTIDLLASQERHQILVELNDT